MRPIGPIALAALMVAAPATAATCGVGTSLGDALQGCVNKQVIVVFHKQDPDGKNYDVNVGTVISAGTDFVSITHDTNTAVTLMIPLSRILYVEYQH